MNLTSLQVSPGYASLGANTTDLAYRAVKRERRRRANTSRVGPGTKCTPTAAGRRRTRVLSAAGRWVCRVQARK